LNFCKRTTIFYL